MSWLFVIFLILLTYVKNSVYKTSSVSIVIPAYNEEKNIGNIISMVKEISYVNEIIVVDDGSYDKTAIKANEAGAMVISHINNQGKGSAIETGLKHSKGDIIAFIDGDIQNLNSKQMDAMVKPIMEGKTDITKTKFKREHGRVTELTAKPLLNFFFPEINLEQPLSGQFAGKRSALTKIRLEKDYGVDVGIILDADANGLKVDEVDIGEIKHNSSSLEDLHNMANEVVRTVVNRSMEYGRISLMDTIGTYIRSSLLGLSLITLGLFIIFFVGYIPPVIGIVISIAGVIVSFYYVMKLITKTYRMFKKKGNRNFLKSFVIMHFPVLISGIILLLMASTFITAINFSNGQLSFELTSRTLKIFPEASSSNQITIRGPYKVGPALENESNIIRMSTEVLSTLELNYNDTIRINNIYYTLNETIPNERDTIRLPNNVRGYLNLKEGEVISDGKITKTFENTFVQRKLNDTSLKNCFEYFVINSQPSEARYMDIYLDNRFISNEFGVFSNDTYSVYVNGDYVKTIAGSSNIMDNYFAYWGDHIIELRIYNQTSSIKNFQTSGYGPFLSFELG
ncbi:MAG: glycosyltransferase [Methanobrevibacter sp.]|nr:glycosyltransferase [Candidatus Methanovirga basalitermitum]